MKKLILVLVVLGAGAWAYSRYFATAPQPAEDPFVRLSQLIDTEIDNILGPLPLEAEETAKMPSQTHQIRKLREDIRDLRARATAAEAARFTAATELCNKLLQASEERDRHLARLADIQAKNNLSPLSTDPQRHAAERLKFFQNGVALSWKEASAKFRTSIDRDYARLRATGRS